MAILDEFLRVVPRPAGVGHEDGQQLPGEDDAGQKTAQRLFVQHQAHDHGREYRQEPGPDQLFLRFLRADGHHAVVVRFLAARPDLGVLKLHTHLLHDEKRRAPHGPDGHRAE